jgi:hypothetical protein
MEDDAAGGLQVALAVYESLISHIGKIDSEWLNDFPEFSAVDSADNLNKDGYFH